MVSRRRWRLHELSTGVLGAMDRWLDELPLFVMCEFRRALKLELLARELGAIASAVGAHPCAAPRGMQ